MTEKKFMYLGYCMKCKKKREILNAKVVKIKNPKNPKATAAKGTCSKCGTGMFKMLPTEKK